MVAHEFPVTDLRYCIILGPEREKERMWEETRRSGNGEKETEIKFLKKAKNKNVYIRFSFSNV